MTLLRCICLIFLLISAAASTAATISRTVTADNVIVCQANAGCYNKTVLGRSYRVISTPQFTVMLSVSEEGGYTRADVSVLNNTGVPIHLDPEDFRIEVVSPKPGVLASVAPADLKNVPPSPPIPAAPPTDPVVETAAGAPMMMNTSTSSAASIDELYAATKKREALREAYDQAIAQQHLAAGPVGPNVVVRGRVYFERDKHSQMTSIVLPISGTVFEFPYRMRE